MPNVNPNNTATAIGRLTKDVVFFDNKDGSKKVIMNVAVPNNFKSKDGTYGAQFLDFVDFIPAGATGTGVYAMVGKGDRVAIEYSIRNNNYTDAQGEKHYELQLRVDAVTMLDSKAERDAHRGGDDIEAAVVGTGADLSEIL